MDWKNRRDRFRDILAGEVCVHPASTFDPISARIAEDLGFECGMYAGSIASLAVLRSPDLMLLTLSEFAQQALRINRAANLPLICEVDNGYGNALNVLRTVQELETAGVVAINVEDTLAPACYGQPDTLQLISVEEGVGKMGVRVALQGHLGIRAAVQSVYDTMKALRDGANPKSVAGLASAELMAKVTRSADYQRWTRDFLGGE